MIDAHKQAGTICDRYADPEHFSEVVQLKTFFLFFLVEEVREDPITINFMALRWEADDGPTLNAGLSFVIFQWIQIILLRNPIAL